MAKRQEMDVCAHMLGKGYSVKAVVFSPPPHRHKRNEWEKIGIIEIVQ
jgi:hypothetical protein